MIVAVKLPIIKLKKMIDCWHSNISDVSVRGKFYSFLLNNHIRLFSFRVQLDNVSNFIGYSVEPLAFIGDGPAHNSS